MRHTSRLQKTSNSSFWFWSRMPAIHWNMIFNCYRTRLWPFPFIAGCIKVVVWAQIPGAVAFSFGLNCHVSSALWGHKSLARIHQKPPDCTKTLKFPLGSPPPTPPNERGIPSLILFPHMPLACHRPTAQWNLPLSYISNCWPVWCMCPCMCHVCIHGQSKGWYTVLYTLQVLYPSASHLTETAAQLCNTTSNCPSPWRGDVRCSTETGQAGCLTWGQEVTTLKSGSQYFKDNLYQIPT